MKITLNFCIPSHLNLFNVIILVSNVETLYLSLPISQSDNKSKSLMAPAGPRSTRSYIIVRHQLDKH